MRPLELDHRHIHVELISALHIINVPLELACLPVQNKAPFVCVITQIRKQKPFVWRLNITMTHFDNQEDFRELR